MTLQKAKLIPKDNGFQTIEFMFNPTEILFEKDVVTSENQGARTQDKGQAKVGFANISPYKVTINKILFDTYETGESVLEYIDKFRNAVQFDKKLVDEKKERPPLYTFTWGKNQYLRCCFIEKLTYKLTMFLPDGTPVRATIDSLTLKEADEPKPNVAMGVAKVSDAMRQSETPKNRQNGTTSAADGSKNRQQNNTGNQSRGARRK
jgi:Contractile injection system tube protein